MRLQVFDVEEELDEKDVQMGEEKVNAMRRAAGTALHWCTLLRTRRRHPARHSGAPLHVVKRGGQHNVVPVTTRVIK
jgi:hypothetical protein